ncbi:MAG TPA: hypothetical protein VE526_17855 [Solirubrobacteraceae bacterium]|jgi:hypothetical protein|nr:hypothetical protein [Solirubrobacteraceae bacterium]
MELAPGLRAVGLERGDAEEVAALIRACEGHDGGLAERTRQDMEAIWVGIALDAPPAPELPEGSAPRASHLERGLP